VVLFAAGYWGALEAPTRQWDVFPPAHRAKAALANGVAALTGVIFGLTSVMLARRHPQ
jgi:hypothetical protein